MKKNEKKWKKNEKNEVLARVMVLACDEMKKMKKKRRKKMKDF